MSNTPNHAIPYVTEGTLDPAAGLNLSLNDIDALLPSGVISIGDMSPPGSPSNGDLYIVGVGATGAWAGLDNRLVRYVAEGAFWKSYVPGTQVVLVLNNEDGGLYSYRIDSDGAAWVLAAGIDDAPIDGGTYGRMNGAWVPVSGGGSITVSGDSSDDVVSPCTEIVFEGDGVSVSDLGGGAALVSIPGGGSSSSANVTVDTHPASPNVHDDEFEFGSTLDTAGARRTSAVPWAWVNQDSNTASVTQGALVMKQVTGDGELHLIEQAISGTWKIRCKLNTLRIVTPTGANNASAGLFARNSGSGKFISFTKTRSSGGSHSMDFIQFNSVSSFNSSIANDTGPFATTAWRTLTAPMYLELENDGTNLICRFSDSGADGTFQQLSTTLLATFLTSIDRVGIYHSGSTNDTAAVYDWFRRIS